MPDEIRHVMLNRPAEAIAPSKEGLAKYPDSDMGHYGLGEAYLALEQYLDAINEFKQAIKLSDGPGKAVTHFQLGLAYLGAEDKKSALEEYKILKPVRADLAEQLLQNIRTSNKTKLVGKSRINTEPEAVRANSYEHE
jgi:tetratricopeptide (TPR) repeat protein